MDLNIESFLEYDLKFQEKWISTRLRSSETRLRRLLSVAPGSGADGRQSPASQSNCIDNQGAITSLRYLSSQNRIPVLQAFHSLAVLSLLSVVSNPVAYASSLSATRDGISFPSASPVPVKRSTIRSAPFRGSLGCSKLGPSAAYMGARTGSYAGM